MGTRSATAAQHDRTGLAFNLAGLTLLVLLGSVAAVYVVDGAGRTTPQPEPLLDDAQDVKMTLGARELSIAASWLRFEGAAQAGFVSTVELSLPLDLGLPSGPVQVDVTLLPQNRARQSSTLLDAVYIHQFTAETRADHAGLVGKPLKGDSGYEGETVWYDPLAAAPFAAKCAASVQAGQPDQCLRTVHLPSGIAAIYSFDATALDAWRGFDAQMAVWLNKMGAI